MCGHVCNVPGCEVKGCSLVVFPIHAAGGWIIKVMIKLANQTKSSAISS